MKNLREIAPLHNEMIDNDYHFKKGDEAPKHMNGVAFKSWKPPAEHEWNNVSGQDHSIEVGLPQVHLGKQFKTGILMHEPSGHVWLAKPTNNFAGYDHTIPKGDVEKGLHPQANAIKEVFEETGLKARITGHAADRVGAFAHTRIYHGVREAGHPHDFHWESEGTAAVHPSRIGKYLNTPGDVELANKSLGTNIGERRQRERQPWMSNFVQRPSKITEAEETTGPVGIHPDRFKNDMHNGIRPNYDFVHKLAQTHLTGDVSHIHDEHRDAISTWTSPSGYKAINNRLKTGDSGSNDYDNHEADQHIKYLTAAVRNHKLPNSTYAYRGTQRGTSAQLNAAKPGDVIHSKGFSSATLDPQRATHFAKSKDIMAIHAPAGSRGLYVSHPKLNSHTEEREMLFSHGAKFKYHGSESFDVPEHHYSGKPTGKINNYKIHHVELMD